MGKRNGFTRWISIMLMVGLIVTSLPASVGFGSEIVQNTIAEEKNSEDESNPAAEPTEDEKNKEPLSPGDDSSGDKKEEEQISSKVKPQTLQLLNGASQQWVEKRLELDADYVLCTSEETLKESSVSLGPAADSMVYMIFTRKSEFPADPFNMFFSLENITSVKLEFEAHEVNNNEENDSNLLFKAYPLDIAESDTLDIFNGLKSVDKIINRTLPTTESVCGPCTFSSDEGLYSCDLLQDITRVRESSAISNINTAGYYGYALALHASQANIFCSETVKPKIVVTYKELEEIEVEEPEAIAAADRMLAARRNIQATLEGSGTVSDPYLIYDANDLSGMSENDNSCYKLMCDIDLKGVDWRPPGYYYWYPFMGYLDGNGYTIKNLHVGGTGNDAWDINAGGLFGYFEGRVENLHIETVKAKRKGIDFFGYAGGIAGVANAPAEIINCSVNGYISGNTAVGGLVGIAYPGVIIESCCAIGSVDMSDAFAYINDNGLEAAKEVWDSGMDVVIYFVQVLEVMNEKFPKNEQGKRAIWDYLCNLWDKIVADFPVEQLFNTDTQKSLRNCSLGGLVGVNYADIRNSYASVDLYNPQNPSTALFDWNGDGKISEFTDSILSNKMAMTGGLVGRNLDGYGTTYNCFFNKDRYNNVNNSGQGEGKTTNELKDAELFKNGKTIYGKEADAQWDYKIKRKSTGGLPLPKKNYVSRVKNGTYEPDIYYDSRVLMKTRESFIIGVEVIKYDGVEYIQNEDGEYYEINAGTASIKVTKEETINNLEKAGEKTGAIYCTKCDELAESNDKNKVAVTGRFQRGSDARPYHVHDLDSLLAMQDSKESHFILCTDIDFKLKYGEKTIQKYWWPAGKTHFSPIKGSLKGNTSYAEDAEDESSLTKIYKDIKTLRVDNKLKRFTIKNLTVQSNRHTGFFASFRGTFSDINIQLSGREDGNATWRDGIIIKKGNGEGKIAGLFTIGKSFSIGAVAGETVNGALIRNCIVTGPKEETQNIPLNGRIKGSIRCGGIVGMNNRGSKIEGCEVLVDMDVDNYEVNYKFDAKGTFLDILTAFIAQISAIKDTVNEVLDFKELKKNPSFSGLNKGLKRLLVWGNGVSMLLNGPIADYYIGRYGDVCIGGIVGENYGTIGSGCIYYTQSEISGGGFVGARWEHRSETIGRNNFNSSKQEITIESEEPKLSSIYSKSSPWMMFQAVSTPSTSSEIASGTLANPGSETEPIVIRTEDDLKELLQAIQENGLQDTYVKQVKDIVLEDDSDFKGFRGTFKGVYDGSGCTISGIASDKPLFEKLEGATIKNLGVKNSIFSAEAAFAGNVKNSTIQNCWIEETVSIGSPASLCTAGFADILEDSQIYNVYNYAQMNAGIAACGIVREMKGSSCIASCLVDIQKIRETGNDYSLAFRVGQDSTLKNCLWMSSSTIRMVANDNRSTEEKSKKNGCRALTNNAGTTSFAFELADKMNEGAEEAQKLLNAALEEATDPFELGAELQTISFADDAFWGVGNGDDFVLRPILGFFSMKLEGQGTEEWPYLINDSQDFDYFVQKMADGNEMEDLYFKQTVDIVVSELTNRNLAETSNHIFKGNYDGGYHTLSGIAIDNRKENDGTTNAALFGVVNGATIKNLGIADSSFRAGTAAPFVAKGRSRVLFNKGSNIFQIPNLIQNCWTEDDVEVTGTICAGGIAGSLASAKIYHCASYGTVNGVASGGIASALSDGEIEGCISGGSSAGSVLHKFAGLYQSTCKDSFYVTENVNREDEVSAATLCSTEFLERLNSAAAEGSIEGLGTWMITDRVGMPVPTDTPIISKVTGVIENDGIMMPTVRLGSDDPPKDTEDITKDGKDFSGGSGTPNDPYQIRSIEELGRIKHYLKSGYHFKLMNDLDFEKYNGNWVAIGTDPDYFVFQGVFDGNGKTISHLKMESSASAGLFGYCAGTIKNLKVKDFIIDTTGSSAGAIAAELCAGGRIEQCAVNTASIYSAHYCGGIAGAAQKGAVINNVYADNVTCVLSYISAINGGEDATLGGSRDGAFSGGFTDLSSAIDFLLDMTSTVFDFGNNLNSSSVGGWSDFIQNFLGILKKGNDGARTAAAGGIVGFLGGRLSNSWVNRKNTLLSSLASFSSGWFTAYEGEAVGRAFYGVIEGQNFAVDNKALATVGSGSPDKDKITEGSYSEVQEILFEDEKVLIGTSEETINRWTGTRDEKGVVTGGGELMIFTSAVQNDENQIKALASLEKEIIAKVPDTDPEDGYYEVTNVNELAYIEFEGWSNYKLMNDINLTGYHWVPLCRERDQYFDGTFDGQGHTIYGLHVETNENGGLFGFILGTVKNLNIGVDIVDAYGSAGGLAAGVFYRGQISKVSVVDNNIALAMMAERNGSASAEELKTLYAEKNAVTKDGKECHYNGKTHIIGGGNGDGAGVGGLAGIVGKDVLIKDCYTRVNVSNANFVLVKELDVMGIWLDVLDRVIELFKEIIDLENKTFDLDSRTSKKEIGAMIEQLRNSVDMIEFWDGYIQEISEDQKACEEEIEKKEKELIEKLGETEKKQNEWIDATDREREAKQRLEEAKNNIKNETSSQEVLNNSLKNTKNDEEKQEIRQKIADSEKRKSEAEKTKKRTEDDLEGLKNEVQKKQNAYEASQNGFEKCRNDYNNNVGKKGMLKQAKDGAERSKKEEEDYKAKTKVEYDDAKRENFKLATVWTVALMKLGKTFVDTGFDYYSAFFDSCVGGLAGESRGKLVNCYTIGSVCADFSDAKSATWKNLYKESIFGGSVHWGRLVGRVRTGQSASETGKIASANQLVVNCYYYGGYCTSSNDKVYVHSEGYGSPCLKLSDWNSGKDGNGFDMRRSATYTGFDFSNTWKMGTYGEYPEFLTENDSKEGLSGFKLFESGDGSKDNPYIIATEDQFLAISELRKIEYYYKLKNDLDLTGKIDRSTSYFGGIGYGYRPFFDGKIYDGDAFAGHFDGNGYKIVCYGKRYGNSNDTDEGLYAGGLFPVVSGSIRNLELVAGMGSKAAYNALLTGRLLSGGCIENVSVRKMAGFDKTRGGVAAGVIAGCVEAGAVVRNCSVSASSIRFENSLSETCQFGGFIGKNKGTAEYLFGILPREYYCGNNGGTAKSLPAMNCEEGGTKKGIYKSSFTKKESFAESELPGIDFNHTWTIDAVTKKPALRCLRSTVIFDYRNALNAACKNINDAIEQQGNDNASRALIAGAGTETNPYQISSAADLEAVINAITIGDAKGKTYSGVYFRQEADIVYTTKSEYATPKAYFSGNYDGAGHKLEIKGETNWIYYIQGAVFRNWELVMCDGHFSKGALNVLLLNCDLSDLREITVNSDYSENVNIVNCLYKNTKDLSSNFNSSSWNGNIVGLEDADEPICINNANADAEDFDIVSQLKIFNAMDGIPSELKRYMYGWTTKTEKEEEPGKETTSLVPCKSEGATVNFDLAEDVEINKVWDLKYADDNKTELSSAQPLEEGRYIRNEKRIVGVRVPAGSCLVFEISYNGDAEDSKYVMMTDAAKPENRGQFRTEYNLKSLIYELWKAMRANREDGESNADMEMQIYRAGDSINGHYLPDGIEQIEVPAGKINTVRLDEETITLPGGSIFRLVGESKDIEIPSTVKQVIIPLVKMNQVMQDETGVFILPSESEVVKTEDVEDVIVEEKNDQIIIRNKEFDDLENSDFEKLAQNAENAVIGTLPADTTSVHYDVMEGEQTISLYKQGEQYRAVPILDRAYQGANIEKVRFYYTDRIYEEVEVDERKDGYIRKFKLKIEDFDNQSTELQNIKITRYFDIKKGADGQTENISKTFENIKIRLGMSARWYSVETMKISTLPTKTYYLPGQEINLAGMEILLNEGKKDECVKPIEELFVVDKDGATSQYCHNAIGKPDGLHMIVLKTPSQYSKEDLGTQEVAFTIDGKDMSFNIEVVKMMPFKAIEVLRKPDQTAIIEEGYFSLAGASIQVTFLNNIKVVLDVKELADLEYTISEPDASGKATVTITSGGCTAAFEVDYIPKAVDTIGMYEYGNLNFFDGESFEFGSFRVRINYNNGSSELQTIDELIRRGGSITYDETSLGPDEISVERTATVSYAGKETTFKFTVTKANIVSAVEINKVPDRHQYKDGTLDLTGGSLKVIYRNGSYKIVEMNDSDYVTVSCDMSKLGEQTATASYTENGITKSAAFTINIENAVKEIDIITPTRTVYPVGVYSSLVLDEGSFVIKYKDDRGSETKPLSKAEISGFNGNAEGKQTIHVAYEGVTANFDVQVYDFNIVAVRPSVENFVAGAAISNLKNGASFDIKYSNGSLETINMNDLDGARITSTEYNAGNNTLQALGTKKFLLHYGNKTKEFSKLVSAQSIQVQNPPGKIVLGTDGKIIGTTNWGKLIVNGLNGVLGEVEITENMLEGVSVGNSKRITVRYSGLSAEFTTNVKKVRSITLPENLQTEHLLGEPVRRNEAVDLLTVEYTDGSKASVPMTDNAVSINMAEDARDENGLLQRLGSKTVTVCYGGASAAYTIVVKAKEIQIVQTPKTKYISGEKLNIENGKIKVLGANDVVFGTFDLNRSTVLGVAVTFKKNGVSVTPGSKLFVNNGESVTRTAIEVYCGDVCTSYAVTVYASEQSVGASEKAYTQSGNHQNKVFGLWYDPDERENAVIVKNNGDNSSYTRRAYVQFDISACKEFAAANGLIIKSVKVKFDAKNRDGKARKTKLFTVNGTWPKNLTWKTATSSFTKYGQSKELQIKERKTYEVDIPVSQLSDKLTLCFEGERHNGGDMQYIYCNNNLECEITYAIEKTVESLTDMKGYKNVYMVGAALDKTQGSFKAKYTDGTEKTISFAQLSNDNFTYNFSTVGEKTVTVKYGGKEATYNVDVVQNGVSRITSLSKTEFKLGEPLDNEYINVTYNDGTTDKILIKGKVQVSGYDAYIPGTQTIELSYAGKRYSETVTVNAEKLEWISKPTKVNNYYKGEVLNLAGGKIKAVGFDNGTNVYSREITLTDAAISDFITVKGNTDTIGTNKITITYAGCSITFDVIVVKPWVTEINDILPKNFILGENRASTKARLIVKKVDGSLSAIALTNNENVTITDIATGNDWNVDTPLANSITSSIGEKRIKLVYAGKEKIFTVNVNAKSISVKAPDKVSYFTGENLDLTGGTVTVNGVNGVQKTVNITSAMISGYDKNLRGKQTVVVTYAGKSATFDVTVDNLIIGLEIMPPNKTTYKKGEALNLAGGKVREIYDNGEKGQYVDITPEMVSGYDSNKFGKQTVTVKYAGKSATFDITVEKTVAVLEIIPPSKTTYKKGEALNLAGGKVREIYDNGEKGQYVDLTSEMVSGHDPNKFGKQAVIVMYAGKSATFDVTVEKTVAGLEIIPPSKTTYKKGEALNLAGGKVRTVYDNGEKGQYVDITSKMVSGYDPNKFGKQAVTVKYAGKSATFDVTVEKTVAVLEIIPPSKTTYKKGEALNLAGGKVRTVYDSGEKGQYVDITSKMVSGYDSNKFGKQTVTVKYAGKSATFDVTVEKTIIGLEIIPPSKTTYKKGEALNLAGGKVRAVYDSGEKGQYVDITPEMVSGYDPDAKIGQTITVTYEGMTATFDVQKERVIESVGMKTLPSKTTYEDETIVEDFDITGGTIEIRYSDGSREEKNLLSPDITITIGNSYTAADGTMKRTIKVSYKGFSTSFDVEVITNNPYRAITNGEASLVQYNQAKQTNLDKLMVKYTGDKNKYTRYAYVKFNLNDLKAELEQRRLEIKSAELCYSAQSSAAGYARDLYLKEAAEKTWTKWSNRPAMSATLASTRINSTTPKFIVQDVTNYVKEKLAGGSVTFGFAASKCEGDSIYIPLGNKKPHLIIEVYEAPTISNIEVETYPTLEYLKGQQLNLTGGSIKIIYSDGHIERKTFTDAEVSVSGYNPNLLGTQTLTISYGGKNTQLNVNVYSVNSITVKTLPTTIQYKGEELNLAGGEITAKCSDGKSRVINMTEDGIIVKGYNKNKKGSQTLTLSYAGKTVTFQINVVEKVKNVVEIRIVKKPKTSYKKGEAITFAGGQFQIIYSDGSKSEGITMNPKTPNGISKGTTKAMNRKGNQIVIVLYTDPKTGNVFSTRYTIKVS